MAMNVTETNDTRLGQYAGFITRLIAWAIDHGIILGLWWLVSFGIDFLLQTLEISNDKYQNWIILLVVLINIVIYLTYYIGFWMVAGQTPGKSLMGVRIVRTDGRRLKLNNAVIRLVGYWISSLLLYMGFWWILFDSRRQGWHDKLARTMVVYSETSVERSERDILLRDHLNIKRQQSKTSKSG
jgi:uncharacterized RDD family membrane protein YckC